MAAPEPAAVEAPKVEAPAPLVDVAVLPDDDGQEAADSLAQEGDLPDEGAWSGMPDEAWADEGRWADDADAMPGSPAMMESAPPAETPEAPSPAEPGRHQPAAMPPAPAVERTAEGDVWHGVVQQLIQSEAVAALVRQLALQSQLVARDGEAWTLRVESSSLSQPATRERLRAALEAAGHARLLNVEQGPVADSPAKRNAVAIHQRQRIAEDIVLQHPLVQTLMRSHGAKIVAGSIKPVSIQPE